MARGIETGNSEQFWFQHGAQQTVERSRVGGSQVGTVYSWEGAGGSSIVVNPRRGLVRIEDPSDHMFPAAEFDDVSHAAGYLQQGSLLPMPPHFQEVAASIITFREMREFLPPDRVDAMLQEAWTDVSDVELATRDALWYELPSNS